MGDGYVADASASGRGLSVQEVVDSAVRRAYATITAFQEMCKAPPSGCVASGRTDRGVHAQQLLAYCNVQARGLATEGSADLEAIVPTLINCLNQALPPDVRCSRAFWKSDVTWFARGKAAKTYVYYLGEACGGDAALFSRLSEAVVVRWAPSTLAIDRMSAAASALVGDHDFGAFASLAPNAKDTKRALTCAEVSLVSHATFDLLGMCFVAGRGAVQVKECPCCSPRHAGGHDATAPPDDIAAQARLIAIRVTGKGFMKHMVRRIVGFLVDVGLGNMPTEAAMRLLAAGAAGMPSATAGVGCSPFAVGGDSSRPAEVASARIDVQSWKPAKAPAQGLWLESVVCPE